MRHGPPPRTRRLLRLLLSERDAEFLLGDLREEYEDLAGRIGSVEADRWYRRQAWRTMMTRMSARWVTMLEGIARDVRYGLRALSRARGYASATVLTLGIGLGGTLAVASLAGSILRPLPFPDAHRLVAVWETRDGRRSSVAPANYLDWRRLVTSFEGLAAYDTRDATLTIDGVATRERAAWVSGNFFAVLGLEPDLGAGFDPSLDVTSGRRVAVLTHGTWVTRYARDPDVVGRGVRIDDLLYEIAGVMPPGPEFPEPGLVAWVRSPTEAPEIRGFTGDLTQLRDAWYFSVVGRLTEDRSVESASEELATIATRLAELHPDTNETSRASVVPLLEQTVGDFRPTLLVLALGMLLVLVAAGVNVGHLALARGAVRKGEIAVRRALGADQADIARQLWVEGLLLGLASAIVGLVLARWAVAAGVSTFGAGLPRAGEVGLRPSLGALALAFGSLAGCGVAAVGYLHSRTAGRDAATSRITGGLTSHGLVAAQVAAAVTLLAGAGLLARSAYQLSEVDLGFSEEELITLRVAMPDARARPYAERIAEYRRLAESVSGLRGVTAVGIGASSPLDMGTQANIRVVGAPDDVMGANVGWQPIDAAYLPTLGVDLLRGRPLTDGDARDSRQVGLVNEAFVGAVFPDEEALGRLVTIGLDGHDRPITIVGIVRDTKTRGPALEAGPVLYRPIDQTVRNSATSVVLAVRGGDDDVAVAIRSRLREVAPAYPTYSVRRGIDLARPFRASQTALLGVLAFFAVTALLLGMVGAYGVASYAVRQRRREIGVRMALGADAARVLRTVVGHGLLRASAGAPLGWVLTLVIGRMLEARLFGVAPGDPLTIGGASILVLGLTAAALLVPARSAAATDPARAVRDG